MYTSWRSDLVLAKIDAWYDALLPEMPPNSSGGAAA